MKKKHPNVAPKELQPFLRPGKYLSEEFLKIVDEWLFLVRDYGLNKVDTRPTSAEQFSEFYTHVHDGWKEAQKRIAAFLTDALSRRKEAQANEKEQHLLKNQEGQKQARATTKQINLEVAFARRTLDVVLWTALQGDHSTLRRLRVDGGQHNLSAANIADAMNAADYLNEDREIIALSTDMLSSVHVGDLLLINPSKGLVTFVELKTGQRNADIVTIAQFALRSECNYFEARATANFNKTDRMHYERVKRQTKRNETIIETIRTEEGTDPNTGMQVTIRPIPEPIQLWSENIVRCFECLKNGKTWAIDVIDECLYLGVYSDQEAAFVGFLAWMQVQQCNAQVFNLTDSFRDPRVRPLGATNLPFELQRKILRGEILVIMCLDILKMIEVANRIQPDYLRLATKKETAKLRNDRVTNLALNGRFVCANVDGETTYLGGGIQDRILFDQQRPAQLLVWHLAAGPLHQ